MSRLLTVWDRARGWWRRVEEVAGSERIRAQSDRYDSGRCMYDFPGGRWCLASQAWGTAFCEDHQHEAGWDPDDGWDDGWDPDAGWGR